eukprot:1260253-Pleurochrysis_carterae.AAC.2
MKMRASESEKALCLYSWSNMSPPEQRTRSERSWTRRGDGTRESETSGRERNARFEVAVMSWSWKEKAG